MENARLTVWRDHASVSAKSLLLLLLFFISSREHHKRVAFFYTSDESALHSSETSCPATLSRPGRQSITRRLPKNHGCPRRLGTRRGETGEEASPTQAKRPVLSKKSTAFASPAPRPHLPLAPLLRQLENVTRAFAQWTYPQRCAFFWRVLAVVLEEQRAEEELDLVSLDSLLLSSPAGGSAALQASGAAPLPTLPPLPPLPDSSRLAAAAAVCGAPPRHFFEALACFQRWTNTTRIAFEHAAENIDSSATDALSEALALSQR